MKVEELMYSMNDIKDSYIVEYAKKAKERKTKTSHFAKIWGVVAACLAFVLICTPALIPIFNSSEIENPKGGIQYDFSSFAELCEALPSDSILTNIPNREKAKIESYGICPEGTEDFTDIHNYSYLFINVLYNNNTGVAIDCTLNFERTLQEFIDDSRWQLQEGTEKLTVAGTEIYYIYYFDEPYGEEQIKINKIVFSVEDTLYEIRSDTLNKDSLIQYAEDMLKK